MSFKPDMLESWTDHSLMLRVFGICMVPWSSWRTSLSVCILYIGARVGFPIICIPNNIVMMHWLFPYFHVMNLGIHTCAHNNTMHFLLNFAVKNILKFLKGFSESCLQLCCLPSTKEILFLKHEVHHMLKSEPVFLISLLCQPPRLFNTNRV